ncbi:aspartyl protease family protein [Pandoraea faecigallinarum]
MTNASVNPEQRHRPTHSITLTGRRRGSRFATLVLMGAVALFTAGCGERTEPARSDATPVMNASFKANTGFIVPVTIGGAVYHFLIDTGASFSVIDNQLAASITRVANDAQIPVIFHKMLENGLSTPNGKLTRAQVRLWQSLPIGLGSYEIPGVLPWIGLDLSLVSQAAGRKIDGMLGMDAFRQLNWVADNRSGVLTVWRHRPGAERFGHCVPYEDSFGLSPGIVLNFGEAWATFRFDTGARYSIVAEQPTLAHFMSQKATTPVGAAAPTATVNGVSQSRDHLVNGLSFDGQALGRFRVSEGSENMLGLNFLARLDRYMFVPSTMEFCYEASHVTQEERQPLRSIAIRFVDDHVEFFSNGPKDLDRYGLQPGDVLIDINGQRLEAAAIADARDQLNTTPVGALTLTIERGGARRTVHL